MADEKRKAEGEAVWMFNKIEENTDSYVSTLKVLFVFQVIPDLTLAEAIKGYEQGLLSFTELRTIAQPLIEQLDDPPLPVEETSHKRRK